MVLLPSQTIRDILPGTFDAFMTAYRCALDAGSGQNANQFRTYSPLRQGQKRTFPGGFIGWIVKRARTYNEFRFLLSAGTKYLGK
jgi:hypothetical protein